MSKYGNSYSGNSFLEWWKTHYGTDYDGKSGISRTESMTDEDFAIGKQLYANYQEEQRLKTEYDTNVGDLNSAANSAIDSSNETYDTLLGGAKTDYDNNSATLLKNYTANSDAIRGTYEQNSNALYNNYQTAQGALADSKRQSQQNASITLDKLKKYLPTQIKAQGLGGLGVSESSMLQAYNNYNSDMGAIESDYQKNKTDLETAYNENKTSLDNQHSAAQNDLQTSYNTAQNNLETGYNSTKTKYEGAKAEAEDKIKQQLQADLATLLQNYNTASNNVGKDRDGKLLVDGIVDKYAEMLAEENNALYADFYNRIGADGSGYFDFNTTVEMWNEYDKIKDRITETQRRVLESRMNSITNNNDMQQLDKDYFSTPFYSDYVYGTKKDKAVAKTELQNILNSPAYTDDQKKKFQAAFADIYSDEATVGDKLYKDIYNAVAEKYRTIFTDGKHQAGWIDPSTITTERPPAGRDFPNWSNVTVNGVTYWYRRNTAPPLQNSSSSQSSSSEQNVRYLPYRATSSEIEAAKQAIQNNDYEAFKRYMPVSYSEEQCRAYYEKLGGK